LDSRFTRRQVIGGSTRLGLALAAGLPLLQACGDDDSGPSSAAGGPDSRRDTTTIADGLSPEAGPLRIFDYDAYVAPDIVAAFEEKYGVKVEITIFTSDDEAISKLASGAVETDLHKSAGTSTLFKLIESGLIQPLNKTYLTNIGNVVASLRDPYYDKGGAYSVPYTVFGTGIGFRADKVDPASVSWETLWNTEYKGAASILDDVREGLSMAMMRKGLTDVNTGDPAVIKQAGEDLSELTNLMNIKVEIEGYHTIPEGVTTVAHTWSGDMLGALQYLPEGTSSDVLGYWLPDPALVNNDVMCVMTKAKNPVLAHLFIDFLIDKTNAVTNFQFVGYQPAIDGVDGQSLIDQGLVPENLRSCVLSSDQIGKGYRSLQLTPDVEALWNEAWSKFTAGG
jgi:spermidine/putrescine transport system substrate-binding protein